MNNERDNGGGFDCCPECDSFRYERNEDGSGWCPDCCHCEEPDHIALGAIFDCLENCE